MTAKPTRRREGIASRLSHMIPLAAGAALLAARHLPADWLSERFLPRAAFWFWPALSLVAFGLAISVAARVWLGGNWSGMVTLKQDHELVRSGPYRWVRHPIYTGLLLAVFGTAVAIGEWRGIIALALFAVAFLYKIRIEERFLVDRFGAAYGRYREQVPALVPLAWRGAA
jgi:protein-S-isoprenylcysteine O-methyltransferase Ste14